MSFAASYSLCSSSFYLKQSRPDTSKLAAKVAAVSYTGGREFLPPVTACVVPVLEPIYQDWRQKSQLLQLADGPVL